MPYSYRVSKTALRRIQEAASFLEEQYTGYALEFDQELQACIQQLTLLPESAPPLYANRRRFYLQRFKYHVICSVHPDRQEIVIHTVVHYSRNAKKWREK